MQLTERKKKEMINSHHIVDIENTETEPIATTDNVSIDDVYIIHIKTIHNCTFYFHAEIIASGTNLDFDYESLYGRRKADRILISGKPILMQKIILIDSTQC
jgi:hypothetical protein